MRMRWLAVNGVVLIVAALVLHTLAPRAWPVAYFGSAVAPSDMMNPAMMQRGMMGSDMAGQDGMTGMMGSVLIGDPAQPYDLRWLDTMIGHHTGGVVMTEHMLAQSARPELRDLAERMISAQRREIKQMQAWRAAWYPDVPAQSGTMLMIGGGAIGPDMMSAGQMRVMMTDSELDRMFLQMMIPHHEGAIAMAEQALAQAEHPQIKELAAVIMTAQRAEIVEMESYLGTW
jgi:uncharacterized protein (DUF305 family)